jgi:RNA-directed DNA polymerase
MADTKAPQEPAKRALDPASESWNKLPWRKLEQQVYRIQKRIFKAQSRGNTRAVHKLHKLLMKSRSARLLAVRRVTQDNQGKKTAGVDGVKTVQPAQRFVMADQLHPKRWKPKAQPVRRMYIPKPGQAEMRPLGIPTMDERARQALVKLALEPEWEAEFEANSYGFRPGRSCHDAIQAIHSDISHQAKYVLDADIRGCFDHINHQQLLLKLHTYPALRQVVKAWLKAGILTEGQYWPTEEGTPQGGVISPLLANIALHGLEKALWQTCSHAEGKLHIVRYADDFVVFHPTLEGIEKARKTATNWLQDMGLELKPSKTRITHTLRTYQGQVGFDFLGFTVRQFPVGKTHSAKDTRGNLLGFKTIIRPSKEAVKRHIDHLGKIVERAQATPQENLIGKLNPVIRGWTNYYRTSAAASIFSSCDYYLYQQLRSWAVRRHHNKNMQEIKAKYWRTEAHRNWIFRSPQGHPLRSHGETKIIRHVKVKGTASPYNGDLLYWSTRLRHHPLLTGLRGKLLQRQHGKCRWCELHFKDGDHIEVDHLTARSQGGTWKIDNLVALHRHCHHQRHSKLSGGIHDKDCMTEEPDEVETLTSGFEDEPFS